MAGNTFDRGMQEHAEVVTMQQVLSKLNELEQRQVGIPVLNADPPVSSPINLWWMYDGRLRGRNPNGGAVQQFQTMTPGATTSSPTRPAQAAAKVQYIQTWPSTWARSYVPAGTAGDNTRILFGTDINGQRRALFGFDITAIRAALSGAVVQRVELALNLVSENQGVHVVALAGSAVTAEPTTWTDLRVGPRGPVVVYLQPDDHDFVIIDPWIGEAMRDSVIGTLGVDQTLISSNVAGYFSAPPDALLPKLRITYTK